MTPRSPNMSGPESPGPQGGECRAGSPVTEFLRAGPAGWTIFLVSNPYDMTLGVLPP